MTNFLRKNVDVFAWDAAKMKGISPDVITHKLHVNPNDKPVKQNPQRTVPYHDQAVNEEVERLLEADVIREVQFPEWLSNTI